MEIYIFSPTLFIFYFFIRHVFNGHKEIKPHLLKIIHITNAKFRTQPFPKKFRMNFNVSQ